MFAVEDTSAQLSWARVEPGPLRIAISTKVPPPLVGVKLHAAQRRAIDETAELLRGLGHEVREQEVDYGTAGFLNVSARYLRGISDDAAGVPRPDLLERRTKAMARDPFCAAGGCFPPRQIQ